MIFKIFLALLIANCAMAFTLVNRTSKASGCRFPALPRLQTRPILTRTSEFIYPKFGETDLTFVKGQNIEVTCPGNKIDGIDLETAVAQCVNEDNFLIRNVEKSMETLVCNLEPTVTTRLTYMPCPTGHEVEFGYIKDNSFIRQMLICFDNKTQLASYSQFTLTKSIGNRYKGNSGNGWSGENFYNFPNINQLYDADYERETINKILGLDPNDDAYISKVGDRFFTRGHLSADADFFYYYQQSATYQYVNAVPQWQKFNEGNWALVEDKIRKFVSNQHKLDLQVYTGFYGVSTLPHAERKVETELYLYYVNKQPKMIPVPKFFWKIVYDPVQKKRFSHFRVQ